MYLTGEFVEDREEERLHQFLIDVDDALYATVPALNRAYLAFTQEEKPRAIARGKTKKVDNQTFALQVDRSKGKPNKWDRLSLLCTQCNKRGNDNSSCFKLHGYPDRWVERHNVRQGNNSYAPMRCLVFTVRP